MKKNPSVYARYDNAHKDAPEILVMDEAFAGVDEQNIRDMFRLLKELNIMGIFSILNIINNKQVEIEFY